VALAAWGGSPIRIDGKPLDAHLDLDYPVPLGRLAGVPDAASTTVVLPGVAELWRGGDGPAPATRTDDPVRRSLIEQVEAILTAGHLRPGYKPLGVASHSLGPLAHWFSNPGETVYALCRALPHLPPELAQRTKAYLGKEMGTYPIHQVYHIGWQQGAPREPFLLPPEVVAQMQKQPTQTTDPASMWDSWPQNYYALALAAELLDSPATALPKDLSTMRSPEFRGLWPMYSFGYRLNSAIAGYFGALRLAARAKRTDTAAVERELVRLLVLRAALAKHPDSLRRSGFENGGHEWTVYSYAGPSGDIRFMKPGFGGNAEMDPEMLHCNGHWLCLDYLNLVPELGRFLAAYANREAAASVASYEARTPYWFVAWAEEYTEEGTFQPLLDVPNLFQAKALILREPYEELVKYLDVPAFDRGDLYYIDNLCAALEATNR
jgi:hypothetical protein